MIKYEETIAQYEAEAIRVAGVAVDLRYKAKEAATYSERFDLRERALYYENLSKEKLNEARILKARLHNDKSNVS